MSMLFVCAAAEYNLSYSLGRQQDSQVNAGPLYHLSLPAFPLRFFLGCNSTSRPADGSLPSPNRSSAPAGLGRVQQHQTSRGALAPSRSDSALKLHVDSPWRDYSTHSHISGCVCSSAWLHLPSATRAQTRLLGDSRLHLHEMFFLI